MRKPYIKFYTRDWKSERNLKRCSLAARGLWIEMICIMNQAEPYGHLADYGVALSMQDLTREVGLDAVEVTKALDELKQNKVFSVSKDGIIFSRRMVDDDAKSQEAVITGFEGSLKRYHPDLYKQYMKDKKAKEKDKKDHPKSPYPTPKSQIPYPSEPIGNPMGYPIPIEQLDNSLDSITDEFIAESEANEN